MTQDATPRLYTYEEFIQLRGEFGFGELIEGEIFNMTPSPGPRHQRISWRLSGALYEYSRCSTWKASTMAARDSSCPETRSRASACRGSSWMWPPFSRASANKLV